MNLPGENLSSFLFSKGLILLCLSLILSSCERAGKDAEAVLETLQVTEITFTSFTVRGIVHELGEESLIEHGFCWSTSPEPTIGADNHNQLGAKMFTGEFNTTVNQLQRETTYHVRAYATNESGTYYGNELTLITERDLAVPSVTTSRVTTVTEHTALVGAVVADDGGTLIDTFGICWDTLPNPEIGSSSLVLSSDKKEFSTTIDDLDLKTLYYVRAFAINGSGLAYGNEVKFRTNDASVRDVDGNVYGAIVLGEQTWMATNLRVTNLPDGTEIQHLQEDLWWDSLRVNEQAYCYYNNSTVRANIYGALYTWSAAVNEPRNGLPGGNGPIQGVCPDGWHLPSDEEWKELEIFLGMSEEEADLEGWRGDGAGGALKVNGWTYWHYPNEGSTNEHRFSAFPVGERFPTGHFFNERYSTYFWTATEYDSVYAWTRSLGYHTSEIRRGFDDRKDVGFPVRCVKDD